MKLYKILSAIYTTLVFYAYELNHDPSVISLSDLKTYKKLVDDYIFYTSFVGRGVHEANRREIFEFISTMGRGRSEYILNLKPQSLSTLRALNDPRFNTLFSISLSSDLYFLFASDAKDIAISLNPISAFGSYQPFKYDNILRMQQNQITEISKFFKNLVDQYGKIIIYSFNTLPKGLGFPKPKYGTPSPYLPSWASIHYNTMPNIHRYVVLDQNNINEFSDDFILFLGGLLVDGQTFIIKTEDMAVNEMITAFNLIQGALPSITNPSTDTLRYNAPPIITIRDQASSNSIDSILRSFGTDGVLIPYQRLKDKNQELKIWIEISTQGVQYIAGLFR